MRLQARHRIPFCFQLVLIFQAAIVAAGLAGASPARAYDTAYLAALTQRARSEALDQERFWHLLLHYKKTLFGSYESEQDAPQFFASPTGKVDPWAELAAALESFFKSPADLQTGEEHPQCVYPARYKWLAERLAFDPTRLPLQRCERLQDWLQDINPERITLVFASHYLNNPASMFGHTLLRVDRKQRGAQQKLLNYGINYAAVADTDNALAYIYKGLFGGFKGVFSLYPYYVKVQEYSNFENRDLWEYELNFSDDQMDYFLRHVWELGGNYFDYWYFDENCSYHLLALLEVADPSLHLTDRFWYHVIPGETIKVVTAQPRLVVRRVYRPSLMSQLNQKRLQMSSVEQKIFYQLVNDPDAIRDPDYLALSPPEKALVLDAYLDYAQYRDMQRAQTGIAIDPTTRRILLERSQINARRMDPPQPVLFSSPPELGHGSARIGVRTGRNEDEPFEEISIRPAYHDLLAKDAGYGWGSQILFLDLAARHYRDSDLTKLDRFKLIDIASLTPYDPLFDKTSWTLSVGIDTLRDLDCRYCNTFKSEFGFGSAYSPGPLLAYGLIDVNIEITDRLDHDYRLGGGATVGALIDMSANWRIQLSAAYKGFPLGHESSYYKASAALRYAVSQNVDLRAVWDQFDYRDEWSLGVNLYF